MDTATDQGLRQRLPTEQGPRLANSQLEPAIDQHPSGAIKHGASTQIALMVAMGAFFCSSCIVLHFAQLIATPLYFINRRRYYAYMAMTKGLFGVLMNTITNWFGATTMRISAEPEVEAQMRMAENGCLETQFPSRLILIANHQIYSEWAYLWWTAYTSKLHGRFYIILKESLKYVPVLGPGMMFFGFIFMARNWAKDKPRIQHRLRKLSADRNDPATGKDLDPMWLLIFPEGTNLSKNGRRKSKTYANKSGKQDLQHQLLPRSTGLRFCLQQMKGSVDWVYDCTIAYEGVPRGEYAQDVYTLRSIYFGGKPPKSINMYWRRFRTADIPVEDAEAFEVWLEARWREKDALIEQFAQTGRLPPNAVSKDSGNPAYFETGVKPRRKAEFLLMYAPILVIAIAGYGLDKAWVALWRAVRS